MNFKELIEARYSCKHFDGRKADRGQLNAVLNAGRIAPTAKNLQEQHVYVVESERGLALIDEATPCRYNASTCIVVTYHKDNVYIYPGGKRDSGIEDAAIVATHMLLAATDAGLDSCWVNCFDPEVLAQKLQLPADEEVVMILDLGYAHADAKPLPNHYKRKDISQTVSSL